MTKRASERLEERLADERSRRVVFVSHCLLNENVRFLGGAARPGAVREVLDRYVAEGIGLVQLPCPEQAVWGGVRKRWMLAVFGRRALLWRPCRRVVVAAVRFATAAGYRRIARRAANQMVDYVRSGFEVVAVIGVGASPSCGVRTTVDLDGALEAMARCDPGALDARTVVSEVVVANVVAGAGMFTTALRACLERRGASVPFLEHDLLAELGGPPDPEPTPTTVRSPRSR